MSNVETMFANRTAPWHGLGEIVTNAPNSAEAIKLAGLDWEVHKKPIYNEYGSAIPNFFANTRDKDNSVLGIVTNKYQIVQNREAFEFTDSLLDEGITYETAGSLKNGRTIWLLAKMPETKILEDTFEPYLLFCNTHDGTGSVRVCMTPIRVICQNTLNLALRQAQRSWSTIHAGNIQTKLNEAKITLGLANDYMKELDLEANKLTDLKVSEAELEGIFDAMFPIDYTKDTPRKINNINEMKANLFKCLAAPDIKKFSGTGWGVMNAVSDMVSHTQPARLTKNYQENNFAKIAMGHAFMDSMYKRINTLK